MRHPSESLNNPLIRRGFLSAQTDGQKQESEAIIHKDIEADEDRRAQKGTNYIDCLLNSAIIFNKFLTDGYYLHIHNSLIFVPLFNH